MRDELLLYYERELDYLRKSAAQFAEKYPKVASRLVLEPTKCEDPHVERLLEAGIERGWAMTAPMLSVSMMRITCGPFGPWPISQMSSAWSPSSWRPARCNTDT